MLIPKYLNERCQSIDSEILKEEYTTFRNKINAAKNPFYSYLILTEDGIPIYAGKGKNDRLWSHLIRGKSKISKLIAELDSPPILHLYEYNLTEEQAFDSEEELIKRFRRISDGGTLLNIMPHGRVSNTEIRYIGASEGGMVGGKTTKERRSGIFSENYDRGAQSKLNWETGLLDHVDFSAAGKIGGKITKERQLGIFDPALQHKRSEWARYAASVTYKKHGPTGACSKEWREANEEKFRETASRGGIEGGKWRKGAKLYNNGIINKLFHNHPGDGWNFGRLKKGNENE